MARSLCHGAALTPAAIEVLKEHERMVKNDRAALGEDYQENLRAFLSEEGTPISPHNLYRTILRHQESVDERRIGEGKAPREPWTLHDLRCTFGTRIAQGGANFNEKQTLMGHSNPATTARIYVIAERDGLRKAVRNMKNRKGA